MRPCHKIHLFLYVILDTLSDSASAPSSVPSTSIKAENLKRSNIETCTGRTRRSRDGPRRARVRIVAVALKRRPLSMEAVCVVEQQKVASVRGGRGCSVDKGRIPVVEGVAPAAAALSLLSTFSADALAGPALVADRLGVPDVHLPGRGESGREGKDCGEKRLHGGI